MNPAQHRQDHHNRDVMNMGLKSHQDTITYIKTMGETHEKLDGGLESPGDELAEARSTIQNSTIEKHNTERIGTNNSMDYEQMIEESRHMEQILNDLTRHGDI